MDIKLIVNERRIVAFIVVTNPLIINAAERPREGAEGANDGDDAQCASQVIDVFHELTPASDFRRLQLALQLEEQVPCHRPRPRGWAM